MTDTKSTCLDCGNFIEPPDTRCPDCYWKWVETPAGAQVKSQVQKRDRLMALWVAKSGPGADLARAIYDLTDDIEAGDAAEFAAVAREALYALNLAAQWLGLDDQEIAPLLRAAANASSSLSRAVDIAEAAPGGSEPADSAEASAMIAEQLRSAAVLVADFCDDLGLGGPAVAAGLNAGAEGIVADVAVRYPEE